MTTKFGVCMEGTERQFESAIREISGQRDNVNYVEIGVWIGLTLKAVCGILEETGKPYHAWGIDPNPLVEPDAHISIISRPSQEALLDWNIPIDICLIDGCHCFDCARFDFQLVEPWITTGGLVLFHDFGPPVVQGTADQHGTGLPLRVWDACDWLGLNNESRLGWIRLPDWKGDFERCQGHDMGVFQKSK